MYASRCLDNRQGLMLLGVSLLACCAGACGHTGTARSGYDRNIAVCALPLVLVCVDSEQGA